MEGVEFCGWRGEGVDYDLVGLDYYHTAIKSVRTTLAEPRKTKTGA